MDNGPREELIYPWSREGTVSKMIRMLSCKKEEMGNPNHIGVEEEGKKYYTKWLHCVGHFRG